MPASQFPATPSSCRISDIEPPHELVRKRVCATSGTWRKGIRFPKWHRPFCADSVKLLYGRITEHVVGVVVAVGLVDGKQGFGNPCDETIVGRTP